MKAVVGISIICISISMFFSYHISSNKSNGKKLFFFHVVRINGSKNNYYYTRCSNYFDNSNIINYRRTCTAT